MECEDEGATTYVVVHDNRIRAALDPILCGDCLPGKDGSPRMVVCKRMVEGKVYLVTVPDDSPFVDRAEFLENETGEYSSDLSSFTHVLIPTAI